MYINVRENRVGDKKKEGKKGSHTPQKQFRTSYNNTRCVIHTVVGHSNTT